MLLSLLNNTIQYNAIAVVMKISQQYCSSNSYHNTTVTVELSPIVHSGLAPTSKVSKKSCYTPQILTWERLARVRRQGSVNEGLFSSSMRDIWEDGLGFSSIMLTSWAGAVSRGSLMASCHSRLGQLGTDPHLLKPSL